MEIPLFPKTVPFVSSVSFVYLSRCSSCIIIFSMIHKGSYKRKRLGNDRVQCISSMNESRWTQFLMQEAPPGKSIIVILAISLILKPFSFSSFLLSFFICECPRHPCDPTRTLLPVKVKSRLVSCLLHRLLSLTHTLLSLVQFPSSPSSTLPPLLLFLVHRYHHKLLRSFRIVSFSQRQETRREYKKKKPTFFRVKQGRSLEGKRRKSERWKTREETSCATTAS